MIWRARRHPPDLVSGCELDGAVRRWRAGSNRNSMPGRVADRVMRSAATCSMADAVGHDFVRFLSWQTNTPVTRDTDLAVQCRHPKAETRFAVVTKVHTGWLV